MALCLYFKLSILNCALENRGESASLNAKLKIMLLKYIFLRIQVPNFLRYGLIVGYANLAKIITKPYP